MKRKLRFWPYENITPLGMDGTRIQFPFLMNRSLASAPEEVQVGTRHCLIVDVAGGITWGDDEVFLAKVLFAVGMLKIYETFDFQGNLPEVVTAFVPHGDCPVDPEVLRDPEDASIEVDVSSKRLHC